MKLYIVYFLKHKAYFVEQNSTNWCFTHSNFLLYENESFGIKSLNKIMHFSMKYEISSLHLHDLFLFFSDSTLRGNSRMRTQFLVRFLFPTTVTRFGACISVQWQKTAPCVLVKLLGIREFIVKQWDSINIVIWSQWNEMEYRASI